LAAGIAPCVPGFIGAVKVASFWMDLDSYAWFLSFGVSFVVYAVLMRVQPAVAV
jgi:cytosine/uracil/thiamine/allantoin permease